MVKYQRVGRFGDDIRQMMTVARTPEDAEMNVFEAEENAEFKIIKVEERPRLHGQAKRPEEIGKDHHMEL